MLRDVIDIIDFLDNSSNSVEAFADFLPDDRIPSRPHPSRVISVQMQADRQFDETCDPKQLGAAVLIPQSRMAKSFSPVLSCPRIR